MRQSVIRDCVELVVLDMAGTTIAATDAVPVALARAFADRGISLSEPSITAVRGFSKREAIRALVQQFAPDRDRQSELADELFVAFRRELLLQYTNGALAIAGAAEMLSFLRDQTIPAVLTTGFDRPLAEHLLRHVGWDSGLISGLITADDVARGRPDPALIYRAIEHVGATGPDRVVVVGDTLADLQAARAAGAAWGIGVLSGAHSREQLEAEPHAAILDSVADLPAWLEGMEC